MNSCLNIYMKLQNKKDLQINDFNQILLNPEI